MYEAQLPARKEPMAMHTLLAAYTVAPGALLHDLYRDKSRSSSTVLGHYMMTQSPPWFLSISSTNPPPSLVLPLFSRPSRSTISTPVLLGSICAERLYLPSDHPSLPAHALQKLYSLLHQVLHCRLDLRHVTLRMDSFSDDDPQFLLPVLLALSDSRLCSLNSFLDEKTM